jgi:sortase A
MPIQPRSRTAPDPETVDLLQQLIESPPAPSQTWRAPVALRSKEEQRRHALRGYLLRTWVDGVLKHAERFLTLAALFVFGYWVIDGPIRDWVHGQTTPPPARAAQAAPAVSSRLSQPQGSLVGVIEPVAPLPFTTPDMAQGDADDFLAPRAGARMPVTADSSLPSSLTIPAIDLDTPVREVFVIDGVWEVADYAAGYMHGTALAGEPGTMALAGHAGLRGGVFGQLGNLVPGDDIFVDAADWRYRYRVTDLFSVWPTQTDVLEASEKPTLVLITCTNWDTQRLIVRAEHIESKPLN